MDSSSPPSVHVQNLDVGGDVSLRRHYRDRDRRIAARRSVLASDLLSKSSVSSRQNAVVGKRGTQDEPRLDVGDAADDGGCHGEGDRVLHSRFFSEKS